MKKVEKKKNYSSFLLFRFKIIHLGTYLPILRLFFLGSPSNWREAEEHLLDFNKTIITLSSSILVLSFSVIKIAGLSVNKNLIIISWLFFYLCILSGVVLLFLKFITRFADNVIKERANKHKYSMDKILDYEEVRVFYTLLPIMFILAFVELISFLVAFLILTIVAINSFQ